MKCFKILVGLALTVLAGCAGVAGVKPETLATTATVHVACTERGQAGCFEVNVFNFTYDASRPIMAELERPYKTAEERQYRAQFLPPQLVREYERGSVRASKPRTFLLYFWNVNAVPEGKLSAYRMGKGGVAKVPVEDVTGKVVTTQFDPVKDLGPPAKVYRIRADVAGSLQVPWSMVTGRTYILTCSEDRLTVYPNRVSRNDGLWVAPESLTWLRNKGSTRTIQTFLSLEQPVAQATGRGAK